MLIKGPSRQAINAGNPFLLPPVGKSPKRDLNAFGVATARTTRLEACR